MKKGQILSGSSLIPLPTKPIVKIHKPTIQSKAKSNHLYQNVSSKYYPNHLSNSQPLAPLKKPIVSHSSISNKTTTSLSQKFNLSHGFDLEQKLEICNQIFEITSIQQITHSQEQKLFALQDINSYLKTPDCKNLNEQQCISLSEMISHNILQPLPHSDPTTLFSEDPIFSSNPRWFILQYVYEILLTLSRSLILTTNVVNNLQFAEQIFPAVSSSDPNERQQLLSYYCFICSKNTTFIDPLIKKCSNLISAHKSTQDNPFGISFCVNFLQNVFGSMNKLSLSYRKFLVYYLLPLLGDQYIFFFYPPLIQILYKFSASNLKFLKLCLSSLFLYWPRVSANLQVAFLDIIQDIYQELPNEEKKQYIKSISKLAFETSISNSRRVAETAMSFWTNNIDLADAKDFILNIRESGNLQKLLKHLEIISKDHWNQNLKDLSSCAIDTIKNIVDELNIQSSTKEQEEIMNKKENA